jgi:tRNA pseudouridine55 synthase
VRCAGRPWSRDPGAPPRGVVTDHGAAPEGLLLVDKPEGVTSHDVIDSVRRTLGTRKVGHAGTLDPMATGLLLVGVGRATRLLRFLSDMAKTYEGTGRLGEETDTLDSLGEVIRSAPVDVTGGALAVAVAEMVGASLQRPPAYSAVKVGGRKLYEAARRGEVLAAELRPIRVEVFDLVSFDDERDWGFRVKCSSCTYVRVLVAEVGRTLGCGAHLVRLVRTGIGPFGLDDAAPPDATGPGALLPLEAVIAHLPRVVLHPEEAIAAGHGRILGPAGIDGPYGVFAPDARLVGVYRDEGTKGIPEVILAPGDRD